MIEEKTDSENIIKNTDGKIEEKDIVKNKMYYDKLYDEISKCF
jgi:hypothetical protein